MTDTTPSDTSTESNNKRVRWIDQDDPSDTGTDLDTDYVKVGDDRSVTEAYTDSSTDIVPIDRSVEANDTDAYKDDEHAVQKSPDGFADTTSARTSKLGTEDIHGNECPSEHVWKPGGTRWRIQMGLSAYTLGERCDGCEDCEADHCHDDCERPCGEHEEYHDDCGDCSKGCPVCREWCYNDEWSEVVGGEIDNKKQARQTALDSYLDCFDVGECAKESVKRMVQAESTERYWNRHYSGIEGATAGFMAVKLGASEGDALDDERLHDDRVKDLVDDVGKPLEKIVQHGFKRARINGWV